MFQAIQVLPQIRKEKEKVDIYTASLSLYFTSFTRIFISILLRGDTGKFFKNFNKIALVCEVQ